jgi:transposase
MTCSLASCFVGIDVAKDRLDLARSDSDSILTVANDPAGITQLVQSLAHTSPANTSPANTSPANTSPANTSSAAIVTIVTIVLEATGGLEQPLLDALLAAGLPVARVHPGRVRHFAKALGVLAKTDAIDARVLMRFAQLASPRLAEKRSQNQAELDALVTCRRQLLQIRTEQSNRRQATRSKPALKSIDAVLKAIDQQIQSLDKQIAKLIDSDDDFKHTDSLLQSVPGVGKTLSATLLAELRELGTTDSRRLSALAGVAPFNADSGHTRGLRCIRGGRATVRSVLYMASLAAMRFNPVIRSFGQRLLRAGKRPKVAITACMRKLLTLLNVMIKNNLRWEQLDVVQALEN